MKRVALFGGSFNPPHVAHQLVALYVLETQEVDELWFIPCFQHPFEKELEAFDHRFEMCRLAAAALGPRAKVSDVERRLGGDSLTLRTVKEILRVEPRTEISLVIGSDLETEVSGWHGAAELRRLVRFIVVGREGRGGVGVTMPGVSSTEIRARIQRGEDPGDLVPRSVLDYVRRRTLYQRPHIQPEG